MFKKNIKFLVLSLFTLSIAGVFFNIYNETVFAAEPFLSVSVSSNNLNINGNAVMNSMSRTTEIPLYLVINTNNKTGYTATLGSASLNTALINTNPASEAKISSINVVSNINSLPINTWGLKIYNDSLYRPIPTASNPLTLAQTTDKTLNSVTIGLSMGMNISPNLDSGNYVNQLVFSVVTNRSPSYAKFKKGSDVNDAIKRLAPAVNVSQQINYAPNIKAIKRSVNAPVGVPGVINIEDSSESSYPILAWYNQADYTIYFYTTADRIYLNENSASMFQNFSQLAELDLATIDSDLTVNMNSMFYKAKELKVLNLSHFNTSNVTNMASMFASTMKLTTLDISHFDTLNVQNLGAMFANTCSLTSLDISSFDTKNVRYFAYIFNARQCGGSDVLTTIYASRDFDFTSVQNMFETFAGRTKLRGGNGTVFTNVDSAGAFMELAKIDRPGIPGLFTYKAAAPVL